MAKEEMYMRDDLHLNENMKNAIRAQGLNINNSCALYRTISSLNMYWNQSEEQKYYI